MYCQNKKKAHAALLKFYEESFLSTQINDREIVTKVFKKIRPKLRYGKKESSDLQAAFTAPVKGLEDIDSEKNYKTYLKYGESPC